MQKTVRTIFFFALVIAISCEDQTFIIKCSDCTQEEPVNAELSAEIDPDYFDGALVQIWEGNLEDSILYGSYTIYNKSFSQVVSLNKKYTLTATYYISGDRYIAVDSATPRVKYDKSQCDDPCYYIYDKDCDLRLKYTH